VAARQPFDRRIERQPVDRFHVVHQFVGLLEAGFHAPVMHHLGAAAGFIDQRAEEFVDGHVVPGFFHHLAPRSRARCFSVIELALRQHPFVALAQPHDADARRLLPPQHNAARRQNRQPCHRTSF
jgi:hypothetical protein